MARDYLRHSCRVIMSDHEKTVSWSARLMVSAVIAASIVSLAHPSATRQFTWPWITVLFLMWLMMVVAGFGTMACRPSWVRPDAFLSGGLILLSFTALLSAAMSPFASLSLLRIWPTLAGTVFFFWLHDWLARQVPGEAPTKFITDLITGFAAIIATVSAVGWRWQSAGQSGIVRNDVPFGHSTYTAGVMVLLLPWLVRAVFVTRGVRRSGWLSASAAGFIALLATSSRGGVLAIGTVGLLGAGLVVLRASWSRQTKLLIATLTMGVLALAVSTNPRLRETVQRRGWDESSRASNAQRSAMFEVGWRMGQARPWTGWGPGTVPLVYPKIRGQINGGVDNVLQLHSTPAQVWATLGSGGLLALIILTGVALRRIAQLTTQIPSDSIAMTASASLGGYGLFALTDHQLDLPAMNLLLVIDLALVFQNDAGKKIVLANRDIRQLAGLVAASLLAAPLWLTGRDLFARQAYARSLTFFETGKSDAGLTALETAILRAPYDPYYRHQLAFRLLAQRNKTSDPAVQGHLVVEAATQLEQSLAAGCFQEFAHLNLGWLSLDKNQSLPAAQHFLAAAREAPHRSGAYFGLGIALRSMGYESLAARAFALEWINDPVTYTAPVWESPEYASLRPQVEREATGLLTELGSVHPEALYVQELWHWWSQGTLPHGAGFNRESTLFNETLTALAQKQSPPSDALHSIWGQLFQAWKNPGSQTDFSAVAGGDRDFLAALTRRQTRHPFPDWHGFLTAGLENENAFLISSLSSRPGYGVLALHPDGPILSDLYLRQQNRFVSTFASSLFPAKGWIGAADLFSHMPALPFPAPVP